MTKLTIEQAKELFKKEMKDFYKNNMPRVDGIDLWEQSLTWKSFETALRATNQLMEEKP